jgi:uncharacterized membrane protein YebE (DUF533 family)
MFDAKRLLDALVGAASKGGQPAGQQGSGQPAPGQGGSSVLPPQIDQTVRQVTGQSPDQLLQKAKDLLAQNPGLAQAGLIGLAGLFLGKRKSGRGVSGSLAKLGGLAVIGTLAYKAYQNRQAGKPLLDMGGAAGQPGATPGQGAVQSDIRETFHSLEPPPQDSKFHPVSQTEDDALLYLRAMVAAASADGQIDAHERSRITKGLTEAGIDPEATRWLERELASPADVEELAATVTSPEKAAQVYAAARIAIDPDTMQEREFLRNLAASLDLDQSMVAQIDETAEAMKVQ